MSQVNVDAFSVWESALLRLRARSESVCKQYFALMQALELEDDVLKLGVPDDFFRDIVQDNYGDLLAEALCDINGVDYSYELVEGCPVAEVVEPVRKAALAAAAPAASAEPVKLPGIRHNIHDHSFDNFVVGPSNREAFAAALAVAAEPGCIYNPFFIYGTNGVGKTHLLQAIANDIRVKHPQLTVRNVSCDDILNDFYELLRAKRNMSEFRASLRDVDVLLIDDIHMLSKKALLQEEFFNIFNVLYRRNKQIVFTSDRHPCEISDMEKRLSSRFEQGMTCEVNMLEYDERLVSLRMWRDGSLNRPALPDEYLEFLAEHITSNVRRLKGGFLRLTVAYEMNCGDFDLDRARELLQPQLAEESAARDITPETIQQTVARHFGISVPDIIGKCRTRQIAEPRMVAMYLCRELTKLSSNEIGSAFARTHANVLHATNEITKRCDSSEDMRRAVAMLKKQLQH